MMDSAYRTSANRQRSVDAEGSPFYFVSFGVIAATTGRAPIGVGVQFPDARKYQPLDSIDITNNSPADLLLEINGTRLLSIPAGTIRGITRRAIWDFTLVNLSSSATVAGQVTATLQRLPLDSDEAARRNRGGVFGLGNRRL